MIKLGHYLVAGVSLSMLALPVQAADGPVLKIENFIGTIEIATGDHDSISIKDADGAKFDKQGADLTIDDGATTRNVNCSHRGDNVKISTGKWRWGGRKGGTKDISEYPSIKITAPQNTHLIISDSIVFGNVETIGSADIHVKSCGGLRLADINNDLELRISGSGDVQMGNAGKSDISISGSGDLIGGDFASMEMSVSGSGDAEINNIAGFAHIHSSGSGDIAVDRIEGGLDYRGSGSSDFEADYVSGDLSASSSGSGDLRVDDGSVQELSLSASGASTMEYDGSSVNAEAYASGGSDISIRRPSGTLQSRDTGGGDVNIHG